MDNNNMYGDNGYQNQPSEGTQLNGEPVNYEGNTYQQNVEYPQQNMNYQQDSYNGNYNDGYNNNYGGNYNNNYNGNYGSNYDGFNNNYQQPYPPQPYPQQLDLEEPVKVSEWVITWLILMIPCVNLVMMFVWAFSKTEKKSKSNFFKAYLIMMGIILALYFVIVMLIVIAGVGSGLF